MVKSSIKTLEELIYKDKYRMVLFSKDIYLVRNHIEDIYNKLGYKGFDVKEVMNLMIQMAFTTKGTYHFSVLGSATCGEVKIFVCNTELNRMTSMCFKLPKLKYKSKWFGLLGYTITLDE